MCKSIMIWRFAHPILQSSSERPLCFIQSFELGARTVRPSIYNQTIVFDNKLFSFRIHPGLEIITVIGPMNSDEDQLNFFFETSKLTMHKNGCSTRCFLS